MASSSSKKKLNDISRVIAEEFYRADLTGACLPCSFILFEEARRFDLEVEVVCGSSSCKDLYANLHFCCQYEGDLYDPSRLLAQMILAVDVNDFVFHSGQHSVTNAEQSLMMEAYEMFRKTKNGEEYFKNSPKYLHEVRRKVHERISEYLDPSGTTGPSINQN